MPLRVYRLAMHTGPFNSTLPPPSADQNQKEQTQGKRMPAADCNYGSTDVDDVPIEGGAFEAQLILVYVRP
ncbi:hypothetical protein VTO73DRAFT_12187 [Trametes versicolor]